MIITNFKKLAANSLRKSALLIAEAGYEAINIEKSVKGKVSMKGDFLTIFHRDPKEYGAIKVNLNDYNRVFIIGIGKGSALASITLSKILERRLTGGIALDVTKPKLSTFNLKLSTYVGSHPLPSIQNIKATKEIIKLAKNLKSDDLLINFICGGGSALACADNSELKNVSLVTKELTKAGADINELNMVRKHLSDIKGGGLAKLAYPAAVVSLIVSDVCGNDLSTVASGPTVFDKTAKKDAIKIINKYLSKSEHKSVLIRGLKETPKDKKYFKNVQNMLFVCNQDAALAMEGKARELGFEAKIHSLMLQGESKTALLPMMKNVKSKEALIAAGETTVTLKGKKESERRKATGIGGRNQESVLGALVSGQLSPRESKLPTGQVNVKGGDAVVMSFASDAHDNSEAGGAIGDLLAVQKAEKLKLNIGDYLDQHNSFSFFKKTGDSIYAKKTCFNVADLMIVIKK